MPIAEDVPSRSAVQVGSQLMHPSHHLGQDVGGHLTWCWRCGGYAYHKARKLARPCPGFLSEQGRNAVRRIRQGKPPAAGLNAPRLAGDLLNLAHYNSC